MLVWLLVFVIMLLVVAGMAIGVMAGRKPIAGSCGGIASLGIEKSCSLCGNDFDKCPGPSSSAMQTADDPAHPRPDQPHRSSRQTQRQDLPVQDGGDGSTC